MIDHAAPDFRDELPALRAQGEARLARLEGAPLPAWIGGGQGRTAEEVSDRAVSFAFWFGLATGLAVAACVWRILTC